MSQCILSVSGLFIGKEQNYFENYLKRRKVKPISYNYINIYVKIYVLTMAQLMSVYYGALLS